jgi:hypothetical protein
MRGNDYERKRHSIESAAFSLSEDLPPKAIKPPAKLSVGLRTPIADLLKHKVETVNSARLRAGVGAAFTIAGIPV